MLLINQFTTINMKKRAIFFSFLCASGASYAQTTAQTKQVATSENGVVVHQSAGVEGFVQPAQPKVIENPISNWSLELCLDALNILDNKMRVLGNSAEDIVSRENYLEQKKQIEARKEQLLNNH